jgi:hypothetical protein
MLGSTIIYEPDCIKLMALEEIDNIEDIISIDLDRLSIADLYPLLPDKGVRLLDEEPVIYDPENGMTLLEINPKGLQYILKLAADGAFAEYAADFKKLARLTKHHGFEDMYEMLSL